jgi:high affinity Mn2+ porin
VARSADSIARHVPGLVGDSARAASVTGATVVLANEPRLIGQSRSPAAPTSITTPVRDTQIGRQMPARGPKKTFSDWNGWYAGGRVGYSGGTRSALLSDPEATRSTTAFGRLDGGLQVGYNDVLSSRFFLGAEGDISFPHFLEDGAVSANRPARSSSVTERIAFVSTLRGRVGYALDRWLLYGTGGLAPSQTRFTERPTVAADQNESVRWRTGWALGTGAEFAFARGWTAGVEYFYDRLGHAGVLFPSGTGIASKLDLHGLRLGLSRTLSWPGEGAPPSGTSNSAAVESDRWNIHGQATYVEQGYFRFRSPYEGTNSLSGSSQAKNTESATAFVGLRLWNGAQLYFNPEIDQGFGLNTTRGVAAFPNGEAQKASFPMPRLVIDRLLLRQTLGLGGEQGTITDGPNRLAGSQDISRITVIAGRLAVTDYFDVNSYANDPRTNFLNWNTYGAGAYDWTMDQLSWTWGALAELNQRDWALRAGYFLLPVTSSNNSFDMHIPDRGEYTAELEWRYSLISQPGKIRLFGWVNHGTMGGYADALTLPKTTPNYPDITLTRRVRTNPGLVLNVEQAITDNVGVFSRASWSPGRVEILGGTDCSESVSLGGVMKGVLWGRPNDQVGIGGVAGGLSPVARAYFAAGGIGILIGDGRLNYRKEKVLEAYYAYALKRWATLSFDYQFLVNPGYNADRGPVSVYAVRVHTAF